MYGHVFHCLMSKPSIMNRGARLIENPGILASLLLTDLYLVVHLKCRAVCAKWMACVKVVLNGAPPLMSRQEYSECVSKPKNLKTVTPCWCINIYISVYVNWYACQLMVVFCDRLKLEIFCKKIDLWCLLERKESKKKATYFLVLYPCSKWKVSWT